jgi:Na+-translocating ferredoxin:NAD+ oxidoreductase RnfG subunit
MIELLIFVVVGILLLFIFFVVITILEKIYDFINEKVIKRIIKKQKQKQIEQIIKMEEGINYCIEECPICMEQKYMCQERCNHKICRECWLEIIERYNICPICRISVKLKDLKYSQI